LNTARRCRGSGRRQAFPDGATGKVLAKPRAALNAAAMSDKQLALAAIEQLPEEANIRDIAERMRFLAAIQEGIEAADAGRVKPVDVVEKEFREWAATLSSPTRR